MCTFCEKIYPNKDCRDIVFARGKYSKLKYDPIEKFITIDEDGTYDLNVIPDDPYELGWVPNIKFCPYCGRDLVKLKESFDAEDKEWGAERSDK